jgi:hypothetical protein
MLVCALLVTALAGPASALQTAQNNADGGVTVRANVSTGTVLDPGDPITFQYQSSRDGAVILFDIDTQGYVTLLHDQPLSVRARESLRLDDEFIAEGEPGVEFVFALAVPDGDAIDDEAFAAMRDESRRINGDPFIAANMIAGELVRDISQHSVFMGYTYFYVSERVEYPCYLCGTCDGSAGTSECEGYRIAQNFDRGVSLSYPLSRGYDMVEVASQTETVEDTPQTAADTSPVIPDEDTEVSFYPYGSEVYYADPMAVNAYYSWGWYDPFYWYYPYSYPYYYSPWSFHIGFGWGWGWGWGGYYCSGWYDPWYGCGYPYYPYYPSGSYPSTVSKYKSKYKSDGSTSSSLSETRKYASKRDTDLRVASKGLKSSPSSTSSWRTKTRSEFAKGPYGSSHKVKTSVSGVTRGAWAKGTRSGSSYKNVPVYRGQRTSKSQLFQPKGSAGKSVMQRSGGYKSGSKGAYVPQQRGTSRSKSGSYAPSQRSTPRPSAGSGSTPRMSSGYKSGSHSSPAMRGGSSWGGGNRGSMGGSRSTGGGMRGGGFKGGGRGR